MLKIIDQLFNLMFPNISKEYDLIIKDNIKSVEYFLRNRKDRNKKDVNFFDKKHILNNIGNIKKNYLAYQFDRITFYRNEFEIKITNDRKRKFFFQDFLNENKDVIAKSKNEDVLIAGTNAFLCKNLGFLDEFINDKLTANYNSIIINYPEGLKLFQKKSPKSDSLDFFIKANKIKFFQENHKLIVKVDNLNSTQSKFSKICRDLRDTEDSPLGCYSYQIEFNSLPTKDFEIKLDYKVWQFFSQSFTSNIEFDFSVYPSISENYEMIKKLLSNEQRFIEKIFEKIINFLIAVKNKNNSIVKVLFSKDENYSEVDFAYHFKYLTERLIEEVVNSYHIFFDYDDLYSDVLNEDDIEDTNELIVIIELVTSNQHLKDLCSRIIDDYPRYPNIVFISLAKEFDTEEVKKILLEEQEKINEKIRLEELEKEKIRIQQEVVKKLKHCVSKWFEFPFGLPYFYSYNYYPTTANIECNPSEWEIRRLIWDFKYNPSKTSEKNHFEALLLVHSTISKILENTFFNLISNLTLVCIPASTRIINNLRYEKFSNDLCKSLGMINAFPYITIKTEKTPKHLGGAGKIELEFDSEFFKDKNIILFDDVITTGNSMRFFKYKMENLGANVIAGLSIGKTQHERSKNPIYYLEDYLVEPERIRKVLSSRNFTLAEINSIKHNVVVSTEQGPFIELTLKGGNTIRYRLNKDTSARVGEPVDLNQIKMLLIEVTIGREIYTFHEVFI